MHPTVKEQLRAIRRLVEDGSPDALVNAARQLRRLEGNVTRRGPFLGGDSTNTADLLESLGVDPMPAFEVDDPHERNKALRALLADVARTGPPEVVAPIAAHLRRRITTDPTLNRPRSSSS